MRAELAKKLIQNGTIRQGTVFGALYETVGMSYFKNLTEGKFLLIAAKSKNNEVIFETLDEAGKPRRLRVEDVTSVDGMKLDRIMLSHNLDENGNEIPVVEKKRGKKPKDIS